VLQTQDVNLGDWAITLSLVDGNTMEVKVNHDVRVDEHPTLVESSGGSETRIRVFRLRRSS
jgi:hypothetical protein